MLHRFEFPFFSPPCFSSSSLVSINKTSQLQHHPPCQHACQVKGKSKIGGKPKGADAYRYLAGEAEVGGGATFLACSGAHAAVGAAGGVLPFPPLRGGLSGGLSFGATSKEKQRQRQEHNAYRRREGVGVYAVCRVGV